MSRTNAWLTAVTCLALAFSSASAFSDPGNGKGKSKGKGNPPNSQSYDKHNGYENHDNHDWDRGPNINHSNVLGIIGGYRDYWSPGPALPPGIQKNLARGKPLPPGIAKKLDGHLLGRLPHYEGYEWQQAGTDLILVALASGLIYEVLNGAFD